MEQATTVEYDEESLAFYVGTVGRSIDTIVELFKEGDACLDETYPHWTSSRREEFQLKWQEIREARDAAVADLWQFYHWKLRFVPKAYSSLDEDIKSIVKSFQ